MHSSEAEIIPYTASNIPDASSVLVFAPHPDDEVFGCGGVLAQHVKAGHRVQIILLTAGGYGSPDGAASDYAKTRLKESETAARILGNPLTPQCWDLPDRQVQYGEKLILRMMEAIRSAAAEAVYAPSPWELHPDHRVASMAAQEAVRRLGGTLWLYLYEVSAPLRPNVLVDITSEWELKQQAMSAFSSQESKLPYSSFVAALGRFRALTLFPASEHAEAFEMLTASELEAGNHLAITGEKNRLQKRGITVVPQDMPLVSVIVRTMCRATLAVALDSVAMQTYPHLEIVLVDAQGKGQLAQKSLAESCICRVVSKGKSLGRAEAANTGMQAAKGEYLIFLDDDDWFYPDHIAKLVRTIRQSVDIKAVHTAVECIDENGRPKDEIFDFPYVKGELQFGNFMPIHSVLFHRSLLDAGCHFSNDFDLYEDWDFWLQVEQQTAFGFVSGVSAAYRIHPSAGEGVQAEGGRAQLATERIYRKWAVLQSAQTFDALITRALSRRRILRQLDHQIRNARRLAEELALQQKEALIAQEHADQARQDAHHLRQAHDQACQARDNALGEFSRIRAQWMQEHANRLRAQADQATTLEKCNHLNQELLLARNHAANVEHALRLTQQSLGDARQQVTELLESTSWRMTQPIRWLGRRARNLRTLLSVVQLARARGIGWTGLMRRTMNVYRREGIAGLRKSARQALHPGEVRTASHSGMDAHAAPEPARGYIQWIQSFDHIGLIETQEFQKQLQQLASRPLISLVMPVYAPQPEDIYRAIASVQGQIYPEWELCICDDASPGVATKALLEEFAAKESRIKLVFHEVNKHISHATNSALAMARGKYVAFLDHDDELAPHALLNVVQVFINDPRVKVIYSDEDKVNESGQRFDPYFKPDFNLGLLRSHNYMCHFAAYDHAFLDSLGGLRPGFEGAQDYDLALRAVDALDRHSIAHIPKLLYHWRTAEGSTAAGHGNKAYAFDAGRRALEEHLGRRGLLGTVHEAPEAPGMYRIHWMRPDTLPLVSIVIPTRNGYGILSQCLDSLRQTEYPNYEIVVIDNGSDDPATLEMLKQRTEEGQIRVLRDARPFNFSALNNRAVREMAMGEFVLLMNNDIEVSHPQWLDEMIGPAMEAGVGCVGARLWYPDGRLQHAGVILVCGVAGHAHKFLPRGHHGYMGRAVLAQDFVAVTAACLLVRKAVFEQVGGLDESLAVAFNDVDFCLKVHQAGYRNHWTPYAELVHHESVSRGYEDTPEKQVRFKKEIDILQTRWATLLSNDPCYSPNLTADAEDLSLAWPPRVGITDIPVQ